MQGDQGQHLYRDPRQAPKRRHRQPKTVRKVGRRAERLDAAHFGQHGATSDTAGLQGFQHNLGILARRQQRRQRPRRDRVEACEDIGLG